MGSVNAGEARRSRHPEVVTRIARYFNCWGVSDGPALARLTYRSLRKATAAGRERADDQVRFAMEEVQQWVAALTQRLGPVVAAEHMALHMAMRLREAVGRYPEVFLSDDVPEEFMEVLRRPAPLPAPAPMPSEMVPQALGKQPLLLRGVFWQRMLRAMRARPGSRALAAKS